MRRVGQKPPYQHKAVIYLLTVVKVGQCGHYKCLGRRTGRTPSVGMRKGGDIATYPHWFMGKSKVNILSKSIPVENKLDQ